MNYLDLLIETATEYASYEHSLPYLSKTKLLKLTYLVEYYYYKNNLRRLTDADWVFYLYGPYIFNFDDYLKRSPFSVVAIDEDSEYKIVVRDEEYFKREKITEFDVLQVIKKVIAEFGKEGINEILDFAYFETEPMLNVEHRGARLDFSHIRRKEAIKEQSLTKSEISGIINSHKKRYENARAI